MDGIEWGQPSEVLGQVRSDEPTGGHEHEPRGLDQRDRTTGRPQPVDPRLDVGIEGFLALLLGTVGTSAMLTVEVSTAIAPACDWRNCSSTTAARPCSSLTNAKKTFASK
ncbi:MAG: hypothetical protein ACRD0F_02315 [Acidimicrobiales bacterium]